MQELSAIDGSVLLEKEERFEGRQSEYEILDYSDGTVTVVMRLYYDGGVNLAKVMIGMSDGLSVEPLTKTRKNSMFVGTFPLEGEDYLFLPIWMMVIRGFKWSPPMMRWKHRQPD